MYFSKKLKSFRSINPGVLFTCMLALMLISCQPESSSADVTGSKKIERDTIIFLGSHLTVASELDPHRGFVALFRERCEDESLPLKVVNAGIKGESSALIRERLPFLRKNNPKWLVIEAADLFVPSLIEQLLHETVGRKILLIGARKQVQEWKQQVDEEIPGTNHGLEFIAFRGNLESDRERIHRQLAQKVFKHVSRFYR